MAAHQPFLSIGDDLLPRLQRLRDWAEKSALPEIYADILDAHIICEALANLRATGTRRSLFATLRRGCNAFINVCLAALRKLATEVADNGLLDPAVGSAISCVKGTVQ